MMTHEFYSMYKHLIDEEHGLIPNADIDMLTLYKISFDFKRLINNYLYNLGNERDNWDETGDFYYDNKSFFGLLPAD
jgi:hypothetical protein